MDELTCCFTGHRLYKLPFGSDESCSNCKALKRKLKEETTLLIEKFGVTHFISGMAMGIDMFAAEIILDLQISEPNLSLECALPCGSQAKMESGTKGQIFQHFKAMQ